MDRVLFPSQNENGVVPAPSSEATSYHGSNQNEEDAQEESDQDEASATDGVMFSDWCASFVSLDAPRRFKSAFMIFSAHQHRIIRDNAGDQKLRSSDIAKMISAAWKELPDKTIWQEKAKVDRVRYDREKAAYKGPWKVPNVKDPNAPKKPMSAFLAFGNERRRAIADANPNMNGTEISCLLSKLWRESSEQVKKVYRDREARQREVFKQRRAEWLRQKKAAESELDMYSESSSSDDHTEQDTAESSCFQPGVMFEQHLPMHGSMQEQNLPMTQTTGWDVSNWFAFGQLPEEYSSAVTPSPIMQLGIQASGNLDKTFNNTHSPDGQMSMFPDNLIGVQGTDPASADFWQPQYSAVGGTQPNPSKRFENYSMDDILEDEELFEDFSPSDVPVVVQSGAYRL